MEQAVPIYLQNFELALEMEKAGFNKECVHRAFIADSAYFDAINIFAYDNIKKTCSYKGEGFGDCLNLPTLGEIELPEGVVIYKKNDFYHIAVHEYVKYIENGSYTIQISCFKTEIEARAHAWLWAKQNEKEVENES